MIFTFREYSWQSLAVPGTALLYDIHGNLPALRAVLTDARRTGLTQVLLGGDYVARAPMAQEVLKRLRELDALVWLRGNGERWLLEPPEDRPDVAPVARQMAEDLGPEECEWLHALPESWQPDGIGVLFVHGSPLSDVETFSEEPSDDDERLLDGVRERIVVFGHSHLQFVRGGPNHTDLVNPGSVGMPLDGNRDAAWAVWDGSGGFSFRRTEYDVEAAAYAYRASGLEFFADRLLRASD
jgi:diadenosine tetraphosphatase ApaH/serine/threonine PP2A family protein phosphatase